MRKGLLGSDATQMSGDQTRDSYEPVATPTPPRAPELSRA